MKIYTDDEIIVVDDKYCFLGDCYGVILRSRTEDDHHAVFSIIVEDDETWSFTKCDALGGDSHWLEDLGEQIEAARQWLIRKGFKDKHGYKLRRH